MLRQLQAALASNTLQTQASKDQSCSTFSDHDDIRQMLPLKSMEELEAFEIRLQDERFRLIAVIFVKANLYISYTGCNKTHTSGSVISLVSSLPMAGSSKITCKPKLSDVI